MKFRLSLKLFRLAHDLFGEEPQTVALNHTAAGLCLSKTSLSATHGNCHFFDDTLARLTVSGFS